MTMEKKGSTVVVGLSGGVDSSVAAALLLDAGYTVIGVFIKAWQPDFLPCTWKEDRQSAMQVAAHLGIPFHTADLSQEFKQYVFDAMTASYARGETPNPDIWCNEYIKFGFFLKYARSLHADYIATGHYARIAYSNDVPILAVAADADKDQSYFLSHIKPEVLTQVIFPIGHLIKSEVRRIAKSKHLPTHDRKDSQGLCFVGHLDMKDFLRETVPHARGAVLNEAGQTIGTHDGSVLYTIGERHGFTTSDASNTRKAMYVVKKDVAANTLTVSAERTAPEVLRVHLRDVRWYIHPDLIQTKYTARYRYRQELMPCTLSWMEGEVSVSIDHPKDVPSPGQLLTLYDADQIVGSGSIDRVVESSRE